MVKRIGFVLLAMVALFAGGSLIVGCSLTPNRTIFLKYSFYVEPLGDQQFKDFVLYLPFPHHEGKPMRSVLDDIRRRYEKYHSDQEQAKFTLVSTRYGRMLKVVVPEMKKGISAGSNLSIKERLKISEYYLWQSRGNRRQPYLYRPRFETEKQQYGRHSQTMFYADGKGGSGFIFGMRYDISDRTPPPFPYVWSHSFGGDLYSFFGVPDPPNPIPGSGGELITLKDFGWQKMPVCEVEYGRQDD